jgi:Flp pilus assembly protein TadG
MNFIKKNVGLIVLALFLILMIGLVIENKIQVKDKKEVIKAVSSTPKSAKTEKTVKNDKPLSGKQYEDLVNSFIQAKNYAIEKHEDSFLKDVLEKGSNFKTKILDDVKGQNKANYGNVSFDKVENINGKIHTVKFKTTNGEEKTFEIKNKDGKYLIIGEK